MVGCHHAEKDLIHRKMVAHCRKMIASIDDTLFQTRPGMRNNRPSQSFARLTLGPCLHTGNINNPHLNHLIFSCGSQLDLFALQCIVSLSPLFKAGDSFKHNLSFQLSFPSYTLYKRFPEPWRKGKGGLRP